VLGVAALTRAGDVPDFSDEDPRYVDIAAPGVDIFSTFPKALTSGQQGCTPQGYTDCAPGDYRRPEGTSFAAPQVSAAAAVLLGLDPSLTANQVETLLERNADDVDAGTGCSSCPAGRDMFSGWGRLDVKSAVAALSASTSFAPADQFEPNDDVAQAHTLWGKRPGFAASLDYWDDRVDVYRVKLRRGQRLHANALARWPGAAVGLAVWRPGITTVLTRHKGRVAQSAHRARAQRLSYRARHSGWYYVEVRATRAGGGGYSLRLTKTS
jgi:hypothetical protein